AASIGLVAETVANRNQPLPVERTAREVVVGRVGEDLRISRPTESLVALRTIRGHFEKVALLAPEGVGVELIEERVRTCEVSNAREIRVNHHTGDGVLGRGRDAGHFGIAETKERKPRLPGLSRRVAAGGVRR